jgi:hypothetical protein
MFKNKARSKVRGAVADNTFVENREFYFVQVLHRNEEEMCHILKCG